MNHKQMLKPMLVGAAVLVVLGLFGFPIGTYLPYLIILACPLMMMFMMGGMNHGGDHGGGEDTRDVAHSGDRHREET